VHAAAPCATANAPVRAALARHSPDGVGTLPTAPVHVRRAFDPVASANTVSKLSKTAFRLRACKPKTTSSAKPAQASRFSADQATMKPSWRAGSTPGAVAEGMLHTAGGGKSSEALSERRRGVQARKNLLNLIFFLHPSPRRSTQDVPGVLRSSGVVCSSHLH
jgi:hypothetical protein